MYWLLSDSPIRYEIFIQVGGDREIPFKVSYGILLLLDCSCFNVPEKTHDHCVKSVHIWSYSAPHFPSFRPNSDQGNSEYGHFLQHGLEAMT